MSNKKYICVMLIIVGLLVSNCGNKAEVTEQTKLDKAIDSLIQINYQYFLKDTVESNVKYLDLRKLNKESISAIFGEPVFEDTDTFKFGKKQTKREITSNTENYYYESFYEKIAQITINKYIWAIGDTSVIIMQCAQDSKATLKPLNIRRIKYSSKWSSFWALDERNMSLDQILQKRGKPNKEHTYPMLFGTRGDSVLEEIDMLKDVPKTIIKRYQWDVDSDTVLVLFFLEEGFSSQSKPIWGFLCSKESLMYE